MDILAYLLPQNPISQAVTLILVVSFSAWAYKLSHLWRQMRHTRRQILSCSDITALKAGIDSAAATMGVGNDEEANAAACPEPALRGFCGERQLPEGHPLSSHLWTIIDAGRSEAHLDIGELLKTTTNVLFKDNNLLRGLSSTFIILGLLGTLFGLADTLAQLGPVLRVMSFTQTSPDLAEPLTTLFGHLRSAFVPSIWGVFFTVASVTAFVFYLQYACLPVKSALERLTTEVWVPRLYVGSGLGERFARLQDRMQENIRDFEASYRAVALALDGQNQQLQDILGALRVFDEVYVQEHKAAYARNKEILETTRSALKAIGRKNQEMLEALARPLVEGLNLGLGTINQTLEAQLSGIARRFNALDAPMRLAAEKMEGSLETMVTRIERIGDKLGKDLVRELQEHGSNNEVVNRAMLQSLENNGQQVKALYEELASANRLQGEQIRALSSSLYGSVAARPNLAKRAGFSRLLVAMLRRFSLRRKSRG